MEKIEKWFIDNRATFNADWFEFLRFPSVGTDPAHLTDCVNCATWLKTWLEKSGFSVSFLGATDRPPVVYATRPGDDPAPRTILLYGHYDVQPADPLNEWVTDPWSPTVRGDRVYARGANDDKGQIWPALQAIRACIDTGTPLPALTLVLDGQEESGSDELMKIITTQPALFKADIVLVCDTAMMDDERPAIEAGLRGVSSLTFRLHGPDHDLHSGSHGGLAPNPAVELARIVTEMYNEDGSIAVEGFLDGAIAPTAEELKLVMAEPFDEAAYIRATGVPAIGGQRGIPPQVRGSLAPTMEVNGFHSGYAGEGGKTIIPAYAEVKLSMRTVLGQSPENCLASVKRHFEKRVKSGLRLEVVYCETGASAFRVPVDSPFVSMARKILDAMDPRGCAIDYDGASIHVVGTLAEVSGGETIMAGFGLEKDRIHAPNESYSFHQSEMCFHYSAALLKEVGKTAP